MRANAVTPVTESSAEILHKFEVENLDGKKAKAHYASWDKLESERNSPDVGAVRHVKADANY